MLERIILWIALSLWIFATWAGLFDGCVAWSRNVICWTFPRYGYSVSVLVKGRVYSWHGCVYGAEMRRLPYPPTVVWCEPP